MFFVLILCLVEPNGVRAENPESSNQAVVSTSSSNVDFILSQEEWVYQADRPRQFSEVLTPEECDLLKRLGCEHYSCRKVALKEVEAKGEVLVRMLFWGTKSKDSHVAYVCRAVLHEWGHSLPVVAKPRSNLPVGTIP